MNNKVKNAKQEVLRIKEEQKEVQSKLFDKVKLFWAFSNEQFEE